MRTPHLNHLAAEGCKLEGCEWFAWQRCSPPPCCAPTCRTLSRADYVQPLCSPTRGTIMTGRYPSHTGIGPDVLVENVPYGETDTATTPAPVRNFVRLHRYQQTHRELRVCLPGMPGREVFVAEYLKDAGYRTHAIGKWCAKRELLLMLHSPAHSHTLCDSLPHAQAHRKPNAALTWSWCSGTWASATIATWRLTEDSTATWAISTGPTVNTHTHTHISILSDSSIPDSSGMAGYCRLLAAQRRLQELLYALRQRG